MLKFDTFCIPICATQIVDRSGNKHDPLRAVKMTETPKLALKMMVSYIILNT